MSDAAECRYPAPRVSASGLSEALLFAASGQLRQHGLDRRKPASAHSLPLFPGPLLSPANSERELAAAAGQSAADNRNLAVLRNI